MSLKKHDPCNTSRRREINIYYTFNAILPSVLFIYFLYVAIFQFNDPNCEPIFKSVCQEILGKIRLQPTPNQVAVIMVTENWLKPAG